MVHFITNSNSYLSVLCIICRIFPCGTCIIFPHQVPFVYSHEMKCFCDTNALELVRLYFFIFWIICIVLHIGSAGGTKFASCFICNESGHLSKNCPKNTHGIYPKVFGLTFTYLTSMWLAMGTHQTLGFPVMNSRFPRNLLVLYSI